MCFSLAIFILYFQKAEPAENEPAMLRITDSTGHRTSIKEICKGLDKSKLDSNDVIVCDTGKEIFLWIGKGRIKLHRE